MLTACDGVLWYENLWFDESSFFSWDKAAFTRFPPWSRRSEVAGVILIYVVFIPERDMFLFEMMLFKALGMISNYAVKVLMVTVKEVCLIPNYANIWS